jgi:outer membrane protein OmpA-like peptidoglycan-associated protein
MKKTLIFIFVLTSALSAQSQSYLGYYYDNYAGVQGALYNPATIVDSRFKADINLFSASGLLGNDYYGLKVFDALKENFDFEKEAKKFTSSSNNFILNTDVMGPSFMFNIAPKHSIAVFTRARSIVNVNNIDGELLDQLSNEFDNGKDFISKNQNFNMVANAWAELGVSYATVLMNKEKHFLKGGLTLKYLQGIGNAYANSDNISVNYDNTGTPLTVNNTITTTGTLTYGKDANIDSGNDYKFQKESNGIGADLGFIYEYRPDYTAYELQGKSGKITFKDKNKYKFRLGLSLTDIGSIRYKDATEKAHNLNRVTPVTEAQYDALNANDFLDTYYPATQTSARKVNLPSALHVNADWNMHKKFYLNLNGDINLNSRTSGINKNTIENTISVTPRYEVKWFSFYLPVGYLQYSGMQAGAGFRLGPLFVGSGSIISNLISSESKGVDVHVGLKIPIYQGRLKDKDKDGVLDKVDDCPEIAGPVENNGCPWKDTDSDGLLDKDDKCPDVAGPKENKGCPWEDTDKDGILDKDDKCPAVFGEKENQGCPWEDTDKDSVLDKDDKCPTEFGLVANNGCPEVAKIEAPVEIKQDVIKKISEFSKTILFDLGKATIKPESFSSLDGIVAVLNEYQTANFKIEGHTDSAGKAASNLKLSKNRAAAVKKYFVDKGISEARLTSEGYGSKKPIASNKTIKGKNLNRRVEINLVK